MWLFPCDGANVKESHRSRNRKKPMKKFIAAAAFAAVQWQPAHAQMILGSIPEEFRGDWCWQENTNGESYGLTRRSNSLSSRWNSSDYHER
jgi:hypothetical protein